MRRLAALTVMLLLAGVVPAVAEDVQPLSFADAVTIALKHNPGYLASLSDVDAARARLRGARAPLGPSFTVSDTYGLVDPVASLQTPFGSLPFAPNSTNVPLATLSYTLADGGLTAARIAQADARFAASEATRREAASVTIGRVAAAYYDLAAARAAVDVAERNVATSGEHARMVQQRLSAGVVARADLLQAQTQLADARVRAVDARNAVAHASDALDAALGVPLDSRYAPTEKLDAPRATPVLDGLLRAAHANRGELAAAQDAVAAARAALSEAKASRAPHLGVSASEGNVQPPIEPGYHSQFTFGFQAVWTLFDNGATAANVAAAQSAIRHASLEAERLQIAIDLEVRQAHDDAVAAQERIVAARSFVESAHENLRLAEIRYRGGVGTILELRDAQLQDTSAQQTLIAAQAGLYRSLAALRAAAGLQEDLP